MRRELGYTIVEVTLFVAVSGLLLVGVLAGFRGSIQSNRLTDTTRSFEAFIEAQYASVRSGSVVRATTEGKAECEGQAFPGASNACIVLGKLLKLDDGANSKVSTYNIVADIKPSDACATPSTLVGVDALRRYCPRVLDMGEVVTETAPQWAAEIDSVQFKHKTNPTYQTGINYIAIMRDPVSELVYVVPFTDSATPGETLGLKDKINDNSDFTNSRGTICLKHDTVPARFSHILFAGGEGVGSIESSADNAGLEGEGGLRC